VRELMMLLPWNRVDGPVVVESFISQRVHSCQKRVHAGWEYQGSADQTKMNTEPLDSDEVMHKVIELFNLNDEAYHALSVRMHGFKHARPVPKVTARCVSM
jgi:hypothetical protein